MIYDIQDQTIVITGRLSSTRADLETRIKAAGGKVAKSVNGKTDLLVVGAAPGSKYDKACQLGIPILEESELLELLTGKVITVTTVVEEQEQKVTPLSDIFGELRSILQAPPSKSAWEAILHHVDRCAPDQLDALCEYVQAFMHQWDERIARDEIDHELTAEKREAWYTKPMEPDQRQDIMPEFRFMPDRWMGEVHHGIRSTKYSLARALDLSQSKLSATHIGKMLQHEDLDHIKELILPGMKPMTQGLVRVLADLPSLEGLLPGLMNEKVLRTFESSDGATRLRSIDFSSLHKTKQLVDRDRRIMSTAMMQTVTTLKTHSQRTVGEYGLHKTLADHPEIMPQLHTLHYTRGLDIRALKEYVRDFPGSFSRFTTLKISGLEITHRQEESEELWRQFTAIGFPASITTLDLSDVQFIVRTHNKDQSTFRSQKTVLLRHVLSQLVEGPIATHIHTLKLGIHGHEPEVIDYLKLYAPHITRA